MHGVVRQSTGDIDTDVAGAIVDPDATELVLLVSVDGKLSSHPLGWSAITLGRSSRCDVVIDHASVSRKPARLTVTAGQGAVSDIESQNGTKVNGERITGARPLVSGAVGRLIAVEDLRWISFGHVEADEAGAMNQFLAAAPRA